MPPSAGRGERSNVVLRAVLDTNVIVSALLHRGPTSQLLEAWQRRRFVPLVSRGLVEEYLRVLAYPKFRLAVEEVTVLVEHQVLPYAKVVTVREVPPVIAADPSDDLLLACAVAGHARYLVSGDHHLLALKKHHGIAILDPSAFRAVLTPQ